MSSSIGYLFNSEKNFQQLLKEMNNCLGCDFEPNEEYSEHFCATFFGIDLDFYTHDFVNDRNLNFEDYKYYLDGNSRSDLRDIRLSIVALIANVLYHRMNVAEGMMIYDVQRVLARYEERKDCEISYFFDKVSNKFVDFPQHIIDLHKLL